MDGKYHIAIAPKYRRKMIYAQYRQKLHDIALDKLSVREYKDHFKSVKYIHP